MLHNSLQMLIVSLQLLRSSCLRLFAGVDDVLMLFSILSGVLVDRISHIISLCYIINYWLPTIDILNYTFSHIYVYSLTAFWGLV